LLYIDQIRSMG